MKMKNEKSKILQNACLNTDGFKDFKQLRSYVKDRPPSTTKSPKVTTQKSYVIPIREYIDFQEGCPKKKLSNISLNNISESFSKNPTSLKNVSAVNYKKMKNLVGINKRALICKKGARNLSLTKAYHESDSASSSKNGGKRVRNLRRRSFCRKSGGDNEHKNSFVVKNSFSKNTGRCEVFDSSRVVLLSSVPSTQKTKVIISSNKDTPKIENKENLSEESPHQRKFISLNITTGGVEVGVKTENCSKRTNPSTPEDSLQSFREYRKASTTQDNYVPVDKILHNLVCDSKSSRKIHYPIPKSMAGHFNASNITQIPPIIPHPNQSTNCKPNLHPLPTILPQNPGYPSSSTHKPKPQTSPNPHRALHRAPHRAHHGTISKTLLSLKPHRFAHPPTLPFQARIPSNPVRTKCRKEYYCSPENSAYGEEMNSLCSRKLNLGQRPKVGSGGVGDQRGGKDSISNHCGCNLA
ncbi:unnamed protein product [Moneuplotes crassus]|uniref:Uncharacterized protein n=1 Tax=Euplotes crassus TaxID=5936 RepID=A0AAD1U3A2_EUPCR|nr:unnamed protein product [Moneuplotes crassus]